MICTFGDVDGRHVVARAVAAGPRDPPDGRHASARSRGEARAGNRTRPPTRRPLYDQLAGLSASKARAKIADLLKASGELIGDVRPISHPVKFYEKGDRPLEIITSRQWFVKTIEFREALLGRGRELTWHPPFMQSRYQNWVEGLTGDWCVSRQRFFGVPFPVWAPDRRQRCRATRRRDRRRGVAAADRPIHRSSRLDTGPNSAVSRAASSATPT